MEQYKNISGNSSVISYKFGEDYIIVKFPPNKDGFTTYIYSYKKAGREHIMNMKQLAINGRGLGGYISTHVKYLYDAKSKSDSF